MIEYINNAIRASAGNSITLNAQITNEDGTPITFGCQFMAFDEGGANLFTVDGLYYAVENVWEFVINAELTEGLKGRYWYCICNENEPLCFKQPFYLV